MDALTKLLKPTNKYCFHRDLICCCVPSVGRFVSVSLVLLLLSTLNGGVVDSRILGQQQRGGTGTGTASPIRKYSANLNDTKVLNVHLVPHTHDDVGWLKTVEQYYYGLNMTIQYASVHDIIESIIEALLEDSDRTFTYVEQKFFSMWWNLQGDDKRESVRFLVDNNQLNFVNGGWCMHDEASTHFMGMIDQTTLGHSFLKRELGVVPTIGWQLDPFGHSSTQASLLTSKMGFDALYFGRIDYQDLKLRQLQRECEGLWNSSTNLMDTTVFWGLTGSFIGMYGAPRGYCFDYLCDDPKLTIMNHTTLVKSMENFLRLIRVQSDQTKGNHIMLTMGEDFQYQRARVNFANLDTLIGSISNFQTWDELDIESILGPQHSSVNVFYSSPEYYTRCKFEEMKMKTVGESPSLSTQQTISDTDDGLNMKIKTDDFFPYSNCEHCFWTGYFTSRAGFKRLERVASSFLMAARQIESMLDYTGKPDPVQCDMEFHQLEDASGVAQHHDGVSGTAKQHVSNDYTKRLQHGIDAVSPCMIRKIKRMFLGDYSDDHLKDMSYCQFLNETRCTVSQAATMKNGTELFVIVYNSLATSRSYIIHLPVSTDGTYTISKLDEDLLNFESVASIDSHASGTNSKDAAKYVLPINTGAIPALGACLIKISQEWRTKKGYVSPCRKTTIERRVEEDLTEPVKVANEFFSVVFDGETGKVMSISDDDDDETLELSPSWGYYTSFDANYDPVDKHDETGSGSQNSGAYIFRPSSPEQQITELNPVSASFVNTSVGMEVHVDYKGGWVKTITRVLTGQPYLEVEYTVGPLPIDDNRGKEVVTRYSTPIDSSGAFYTDSNGREFIRRERNIRPTWDLNVYEPVSGNFYPVNAAIYIEDDEHEDGMALAVATDRTEGGASLVDGSIELMIHRRILADDWRGVDEALNETQGGITPCPPYGNATRIGDGIIIRGKHRIMVGKSRGDAARLARSMMDSTFAEPIVLVGSSIQMNEIPFRTSNFTSMKGQALSPNIMLLTRSLLYNEPTRKYLLRVAHQYGLGEDANLSTPVTVDLSLFFPGEVITDVLETTLSGNQDYASWLARKLDWTAGTSARSRNSSEGTIIQLSPMDIRTFIVTVSET